MSCWRLPTRRNQCGKKSVQITPLSNSIEKSAGAPATSRPLTPSNRLSYRKAETQLKRTCPRASCLKLLCLLSRVRPVLNLQSSAHRVSIFDQKCIKPDKRMGKRSLRANPKAHGFINPRPRPRQQGSVTQNLMKPAISRAI